MIGKIIILPFWILWKAIGAALSLFRLVFGSGFGLFRFVLNRRIGTAAILFLGFLLGKEYLDRKAQEQRKHS